MTEATAKIPLDPISLLVWMSEWYLLCDATSAEKKIKLAALRFSRQITVKDYISRSFGTRSELEVPIQWLDSRCVRRVLKWVKNVFPPWDNLEEKYEVGKWIRKSLTQRSTCSPFYHWHALRPSAIFRRNRIYWFRCLSAPRDYRPSRRLQQVARFEYWTWTSCVFLFPHRSNF